MFNKFILLIGVSLITACASSGNYAPIYTYDEFLVNNNSNQPIPSLKVTFSDSEPGLSCENIAALGICTVRFANRRYMESPFSVDWAFGNNPSRVDELNLKVPAYFTLGPPLRMVLEISPQGEISAHFEKESCCR